MLKVGSSSFEFDSQEITLSIVKQAEFINDSVLCDRFSYEKLKKKVLKCKLEYFHHFLMYH